jgi:hypothetical protein
VRTSDRFFDFASISAALPIADDPKAGRRTDLGRDHGNDLEEFLDAFEFGDAANHTNDEGFVGPHPRPEGAHVCGRLIKACEV